jgi:hypothetical protein
MLTPIEPSSVEVTKYPNISPVPATRMNRTCPTSSSVIPSRATTSTRQSERLSTGRLREGSGDGTSPPERAARRPKADSRASERAARFPPPQPVPTVGSLTRLVSARPYTIYILLQRCLPESPIATLWARKDGVGAPDGLPAFTHTRCLTKSLRGFARAKGIPEPPSSV